MTRQSYMTPIAIPPSAKAKYPDLTARTVGPPPGISDDDCGTPEVLFGRSPEGYPVYADYWQPTPDQMALLNAGGYLELRQYVGQMVMHSLTVHEREPDDPGDFSVYDLPGGSVVLDRDGDAWQLRDDGWATTASGANTSGQSTHTLQVILGPLTVISRGVKA